MFTPLPMVFSNEPFINKFNRVLPLWTTNYTQTYFQLHTSFPAFLPYTVKLWHITSNTAPPLLSIHGSLWIEAPYYTECWYTAALYIAPPQIAVNTYGEIFQFYCISFLNNSLQAFNWITCKSRIFAVIHVKESQITAQKRNKATKY